MDNLLRFIAVINLLAGIILGLLFIAQIEKIDDNSGSLTENEKVESVKIENRNNKTFAAFSFMEGILGFIFIWAFAIVVENSNKSKDYLEKLLQQLKNIDENVIDLYKSLKK